MGTSRPLVRDAFEPRHAPVAAGAQFREHDRHASDLVRVTDVDCRAPRGPAGAEEASAEPRLVFVRGGVFARSVRGREVTADAASIQFFNGSEPHRVAHPTDGGDACTVLLPNAGVLADALERRGLTVRDSSAPFALPAVVLPAPAQRRMLALLHAVRAAPDELLADELSCALLEAAADALADHAGIGPAASPSTAADERLAAAARALIAARPGVNDGLAALGRALDTSPFHLARRFRAVTGTTLHRHRTELRLAAALERLADGARDIAAVAADLGFAHHSHLTSAFRRAFDIAPGDARATYRDPGSLRALAAARGAFARVP